MSRLRITDLKAFQCGSFTFVKVYTNEGITGVGENISVPKPLFLGQIEVLRKLVVGEDPCQIERIWRKLYSQLSFWHGNSMISGLDVALWDIKGKALDVPVYELLGGLYRDKLRG